MAYVTTDGSRHIAQQPSEETGSRLGVFGVLLAGYILFLPIQIQTKQTIRIAPSDAFLLLYVLFGFTRLKFYRHVWSIWHIALIGVFIMGIVVSVVKTGTVSQYALLQKGIGLVVLYFGYTVVTIEASSWFRINRFLRMLILSVACQNVVAIAFFIATRLTGYSLDWMNCGVRLSGMLVDPNAYGGLLVLTFAIQATTYFFKLPIVPNLAGWLSNFILAVGIVLTFSRSAWIGVTLIVLVFVIVSIAKFKPRLMMQMACIGVLAFSAIYYGLGSGSLDFLTTMASRGDQIDTRFVIIDHALDMFADNPILGAGIGVFSESYDVIIHNTPIWMLAEFGLVGFIVFLFFSAWFVFKGISTYRFAEAAFKPLVLGLLMAYMAMVGLSMGIEALYQRHWWLIMAFIASGFRLSSLQNRIALTHL